MRFLFFLFLFFIFSFLNAQENPQVTDSLPTKTIQLIDTLKVLKVSGDFKQTMETLQVRDSVVFDLKDQRVAKNADSLWLQELYQTDRFEEVYGSINQQNYEPVDYQELPTELLKQRLAEMDAKTPFHIEYNPSLESVIKGYLKNRRKTMSKLMALSDFYFPMFEETLDKYNLPLEIKYLAIVESALVPTAKSRVGATGLWQFMFSTGKLFGLDVNSYVDDRSDPLKSTEAACQYLKKLYASFNDWDLALAAYNSGPGNVSKAIRRSGGKTNYWNIRQHLPRETAGYLPAFLATMYIFEYAEAHGFKSSGPEIPYIATDTVKVKKMVSLEQIAKVSKLNLEMLQFLNPQYKLGFIPIVKDKTYYLRLPIEAIGIFVNNEEAIYAYAATEFNKREKPLPKLFDSSDRIRYRVRSGDYLGKIAKKYGVGISQIKRWNSLRSTKLKIGQRLIIYPKRM
ncbi:MAG: transglycosylase SLT domain-containing protein [Flavobacteriales bacterium]